MMCTKRGFLTWVFDEFHLYNACPYSYNSYQDWAITNVDDWIDMENLVNEKYWLVVNKDDWKKQNIGAFVEVPSSTNRRRL